MFFYGWAKGDGNDVVFTMESLFILLGVCFGFYISLIIPGYLLHKIFIMKDKDDFKDKN